MTTHEAVTAHPGGAAKEFGGDGLSQCHGPPTRPVGSVEPSIVAARSRASPGVTGENWLGTRSR